jgi:adenosylmethionine-8-amino-7-oxononanoate aminotransferase
MTDTRWFVEDGLTIVRGEGCHVWDDLGNRYLSATAGLWNVSCGFGRPEIIGAVHDQLVQLSYGTLFRYGNEPAVRLAAQLLELTGLSGGKVFYASSGSAAVDTAMKVARRYQRLVGRPGADVVVSLEHSYHGTTYGAMTATAEDLEQVEYAADLDRVVHLPLPPAGAAGRDEHCVAAAAWRHAVERTLERHRGRIAALVLEPVLGSAGVIVPPTWAVRHLVERCRHHGALVVADEVATGFGRCGVMFGVELHGVSPDLVVLSKGINSGYLPLAAVAVSDDVYAAFEAGGAVFAHGETQAGNPAACAAALATIRLITEVGLVARAATVGTHLLAGLEGLTGLPATHDVRGVGLMAAVELRVHGRPLSGREILDVVRAFQRRGVLVHPARSGFSVFPPLVITEAEVDEVVTAAHAVVTGLGAGR